jgi:hypothetical protein
MHCAISTSSEHASHGNKKRRFAPTNEEANDSIGAIETKTKREKNYGNNKQ